MSTIMIVIFIVISLIVVYKLIANNYIKRMRLINKSMEDITNNGFAIIKITSSLYIGTLQTEKYETYVSPNALGFILNNEEILVISTMKKNTLAINFSSPKIIFSDDELEELIINN